MKKIISCLLVVMILCSFVLMLFACDADELKHLTYIDENGNEVNINIKKTSDVDEVSKSMLALGEKEINRSNLTSLLFTLACDVSVDGTQDNQPFSYSVNGSSEFGISVKDHVEMDTFMKFLEDVDLYFKMDVSGQAPKNAMFEVEDEEGENDQGKVNYLIPKPCDAHLQLLYNNYVFYAKGTFSDMLTNKAKEYYTGVEKIKDNYGYLAIGTGISLLEKLINMDNATEIMKEVRSNDSYINTVIKILQIEEKLEKSDEDKNASIKAALYPQVKECVRAFNVQIIKTKGSKATLSFNITRTAIAYMATLIPQTAAYFEGFDGNCYFELTIDAKNMIDATLTFDISDMVSFLMYKLATDSNVQFTSVRATGSSTLSANVDIPRITNEEIASAKEIKLLEIMGLVAKAAQLIYS